MIIVEKKYKGSPHVWRTLFAYKMEPIPPGVKVDRVIRQSRSWDKTPFMEAMEWVKLFSPFCEVCETVEIDSEPHPSWVPFGRA